MTDKITDQLAEALREAVRALNVHPRFKVQETNSYAVASQCDDALRVYDRYRQQIAQIADPYARSTHLEIVDGRPAIIDETGEITGWADE